MALQWNTGTTGQTVYLVRWNTSGQAWNGAAFATYTTTRDTWDQVMAEIGVTGLYRIATIPGGDGYATIEVFRQVGGSPDHAADVSLAKGDGYVRSGALWPDDQQLKGFINTDLVEESTGNVATNFGVFWNDGDSAVSDVRLSYFDTIKTKTDFLPSATAGAAGGVFIAGANAATTVNITGDLTGNVSGSVGSVTGNVGGMTGTVNTFDELISSADTLDTLYAGSDLEADIAAISSPQVLQSTTIATLASQTGFTLTAGSADNDAYNGCTAIFVDQSTAVQKAVGVIDDYVGSTKTVTLAGAPAFTIATGDTIHVVSPAGLAEATITDVGTAATSSRPVEHTSIPNARIFLVKARADGTFGVSGSGRIRMLPGETLWFAVDLKGTQLEPGDLVDSVTAPTVTGAQATNLTVPTYGVFGTLVKFKCVLSGSAETTDTINVKLTITPESGETLIVTVPVTVGS